MPQLVQTATLESEICKCCFLTPLAVGVNVSFLHHPCNMALNLVYVLQTNTYIRLITLMKMKKRPGILRVALALKFVDNAHTLALACHVPPTITGMELSVKNVIQVVLLVVQAQNMTVQLASLISTSIGQDNASTIALVSLLLEISLTLTTAILPVIMEQIIIIIMRLVRKPVCTHSTILMIEMAQGIAILDANRNLRSRTSIRMIPVFQLAHILFKTSLRD